MALSAEQQIKIWLRDVDRAVERFDRKDRVSALRKGAALVRKDVRGQIPVRKSANGKTFLNPRYEYTGKKRSKRGEGKIVAYYAPGNLKKSIQAITFRRSNDVFVGPKFSKKKQRIYGRTASTADGYYAHMLYDSTRRFRAQVLIPALNKNAEQIRLRVLSVLREKVPQYLGRRI